MGIRDVESTVAIPNTASKATIVFAFIAIDDYYAKLYNNYSG
jgi:hypothetical protein